MHELHNRAALVLILALSTLLLPSPEAQAGPDAERASFAWSVPERFGEEVDKLGRIVVDQPGDVKPGPWPVRLRAIGPACAPEARYRWSLPRHAIHPQRIGRCAFLASFPRERAYKVRLRAVVGSKRLEGIRKVVVDDKLIVSIGDSVAAGEGVPDVAGVFKAAWQDRRCHRSARAGPALAAKRIEEDDPHTSVTFVHLACSGATIAHGLIGTYAGVESRRGEPPLEAQVDVLNRVAKVRPVDAALISVGANDVNFGDVVRFCIFASPGNCFDKPFDPPGPLKSEKKTAEVVAEALDGLPEGYRTLDREIAQTIPHSRIHIVDYFDPLSDNDGSTCRRGPPLTSRAELEAARTKMLAPLNEAVAAGAADVGWNLIADVAADFRGHGYCADTPWVTRLKKSLFTLGGSPPAKRALGTLHPNKAGQEAIGERIAQALELEFFPRRKFIAQPRREDEGSGWSPPWWAIAIVTPLSPIGGAALIVVKEWEQPVTPVILGVLLAALLLVGPLGRALWQVLCSLGVTLRPLLLPLFVVLALGAIRFGTVAEILVSFAAVVLGWFLVVAPSARQSAISAKWGKALAKSLLKNFASILAVGFAVWVVGMPLVGSTPYFETVEDHTSALVALSIALWFGAVGLRLFSFAESRVRALAALVAGLALLRLSMALGVLPGEPGLRDSIPAAVPVLLAAAGALLLVDVALTAVPAPQGGGTWRNLARSVHDWPQGAWVKEETTARARGIGFAAAMTASVVLLVATTVGLWEAAERGKALNPPEGVSVEAKDPRRAPGDGDAELNRRYAPVLAFTEDERWTPIRVEPYLNNAKLYGPGGLIEKGPTLKELPRSCPGGRSDCYRLTIECESGDLDCAMGDSRKRDQEKLYREGAVYVRGPLRKSERRGLFPDKGPFRDELSTLIQYWYFYYYDEWKAPVFAGLLTQKHEGDWEVVTLGLDRENKPLFVADSAHCAGSWRRWEEVEVSTLLPGPRVHPLVAVAEGSHANYPDPKQKRTSDPGFCAGLPEGVAAAISYASNIRDKTEFGWSWYPPGDGWIELRREGPGPMTFPGTWGADDRTTLTNFNTHEIGKPKPGPKTPPLQSSWTRPVTTIFCGRYRPPRETARSALHC